MNIVIMLVTVLMARSSCLTVEQVDKIKEKCFDLNDIVVEDRVVYNPENPKLKCFNACLYTNTGMMQNGKMDIEKSMEIIQAYFNKKLRNLELEKKSDMDEFRIPRYKEFINSGLDTYKTYLYNCMKYANKEVDVCEVAHAFVKCL